MLKLKKKEGGEKMKKILISLSVLLVVLFLPVVILAQNQGNQGQNQNQIQIQNQGEDQQIQVGTQERESLQEGQELEVEAAKKVKLKSVNPRSENARQNMSVVAETIEELLITQGAKGGIGQQVREIAQEQKQAQVQTEEQFNKLESRRGLMKRLFGPDYKAIKNLNKQVEQNQLRVQQLQQLQNQAVNQDDQAQIQETVQALVEQNTSLEEQIQAEEKIGSLFGWLIKLFIK